MTSDAGLTGMAFNVMHNNKSIMQKMEMKACFGPFTRPVLTAVHALAQASYLEAESSSNALNHTNWTGFQYAASKLVTDIPM